MQTLGSWSLALRDHLIQSCFTGKQKPKEIKRLIQGHRVRVSIWHGEREIKDLTVAGSRHTCLKHGLSFNMLSRTTLKTCWSPPRHTHTHTLQVEKLNLADIESNWNLNPCLSAS